MQANKIIIVATFLCVPLVSAMIGNTFGTGDYTLATWSTPDAAGRTYNGRESQTWTQ